MVFKTIITAIGLTAVSVPILTYADVAFADTIPVDCTTLPNDLQSKLIEGEASYRFAADILRTEGRDDFLQDDDNVQSLCLADSFKVGTNQVRITYAGPLQPRQRLLYRVEITGEKTREFLVLYSGVFNLMSNVHLAFSMVETQGNKLDMYKIYHKEPPYKQVRRLVKEILVEKARPVVSAVWQEGHEKPDVTVFDGQ